ncbi:MAG: MarC family protein [Bryobacterales bacterium]|nr:MarC family protein [Bryobacterales bacterium]MBV9399407.1 MarC family protein [Bryobacterales bacterium]
MPVALRELLENTLLIVAALFPIVDPIGNTPIFLALTRGLSSQGRSSLARLIALNSLILILASVFIGTYILNFFGISLPAVQVGGGLVLISTGWALLRRPDEAHSEESDARRDWHEDTLQHQAFYPLTLPLTVGPGAISVAITLGANRPGGGRQWPLIAGMLIGSALIGLSIYLSYRYAEGIARVLGESAMNVIIRLSSFILVCIGVQILWNGLSALLKTVVT